MSVRLNFFEPYENIPAYYENQLTRALLVILRYSPLAHGAWLRLVDDRLRLERLPAAQFRTQQARALRASSQVEGEDETIRGISVLLTPGEEKVRPAVGARANGGQILDGIIEYSKALLVVVENKLWAGQGHRQVTQISVDDARVEFDLAAKTVRWQELLESFADIAASGLATGAEFQVIEDFLSFVERHFGQLGPYSSLRRAGTSKQRIRRRLDAILTEILDAELTGQGLGWRKLPERPDGRYGAVKMVQLSVSKDLSSVRLTLYPGDTLTQSKVLNRRAEAVRGLLALPGWTVTTNYHWGFMEAGLWWPRGPIAPRDYIDYWIAHIGKAGKIPREGWPAEWQRLEAAGMVTPEDRASFDAKFTQKNFTTATPKPGLRCDYAWPMTAATALDDSDRFVATVRERLLEVLEQLGESHSAGVIRGAA